jgi:hypothetical protein
VTTDVHFSQQLTHWTRVWYHIAFDLNWKQQGWQLHGDVDVGFSKFEEMKSRPEKERLSQQPVDTPAATRFFPVFRGLCDAPRPRKSQLRTRQYLPCFMSERKREN